MNLYETEINPGAPVGQELYLLRMRHALQTFKIKYTFCISDKMNMFIYIYLAFVYVNILIYKYLI